MSDLSQRMEVARTLSFEPFIDGVVEDLSENGPFWY